LTRKDPSFGLDIFHFEPSKMPRKSLQKNVKARTDEILIAFYSEVY